MDLCVVAREPLDRWRLVDEFGVTPEQGLDPDQALARALHPTSTVGDVLVLVRGPEDVDWVAGLRAAMAASARVRVTALVADGGLADAARGAGSDVVLGWDDEPATGGPMHLLDDVSVRCGELAVVADAGVVAG